MVKDLVLTTGPEAEIQFNAEAMSQNQERRCAGNDYPLSNVLKKKKVKTGYGVLKKIFLL